MRTIGRSPEGFSDYIIRSCTHNGVWVVDHIDHETSEKTTYDFVNKDILSNSGEEPVPIGTLGGQPEKDFYALQKTLNKALLH